MLTRRALDIPKHCPELGIGNLFRFERDCSSDPQPRSAFGRAIVILTLEKDLAACAELPASVIRADGIGQDVFCSS